MINDHAAGDKSPKAERETTMNKRYRNLYRIEWIIKLNRHETKEYCYIEAYNATAAKKYFYEYGYHNSLYHPNSHAFHVEVKRDDDAVNIPINIFIMIAR